MVKYSSLAAALVLLAQACSCAKTAQSTYFIKVRQAGTLDPYITAGNDEEDQENHYLCRSTETMEHPDPRERDKGLVKVRRLAIRSETDYLTSLDGLGMHCQWSLFPVRKKVGPSERPQPPTFALWVPGLFLDQSRPLRPVWVVPGKAATPWITVYPGMPIQFIGLKEEDFFNGDPVGKSEMQLIAMNGFEQPLYECRSNLAGPKPAKEMNIEVEKKKSDSEDDSDEGEDDDTPVTPLSEGDRWDIYTPAVYQKKEELGLQDCNKIEFWIQPKDFTIVPDRIAIEEKFAHKQQQKAIAEQERLARVAALKDRLREDPREAERLGRLEKMEVELETQKRREKEEKDPFWYGEDDIETALADEDDFKYQLRVPRFDGRYVTSNVYNNPAHVETARKRKIVEQQLRNQRKARDEIKARLTAQFKAQRDGLGDLLGKRPGKLPEDRETKPHFQCGSEDGHNKCTYYAEDGGEERVKINTFKGFDSDSVSDSGPGDMEPRLIKQVHTTLKTGVPAKPHIQDMDSFPPSSDDDEEPFRAGDYVMLEPIMGRTDMPILSRVVTRTQDGNYIVRLAPKINIQNGVNVPAPAVPGRRLTLVRRMTNPVYPGECHIPVDLWERVSGRYEEVIRNDRLLKRDRLSRDAVIAKGCLELLTDLAWGYEKTVPPPESRPDGEEPVRKLTEAEAERESDWTHFYHNIPHHNHQPPVADAPAGGMFGYILPSGKGRWEPKRDLRPRHKPKKHIRKPHNLQTEQWIEYKRKQAGKIAAPSFDINRFRNILRTATGISFSPDPEEADTMSEEQRKKFEEEIKYWDPRTMKGSVFWQRTPERFQRHKGQSLERDVTDDFEVPDSITAASADGETHYRTEDSTPSDIQDQPDGEDPDPEDDGGYIGDELEQGNQGPVGDGGYIGDSDEEAES